MLYLDVIQGGQTVRYSAGSAASKPLHSSAIGKAFLGRLDPGERAAEIARLPMDTTRRTRSWTVGAGSRSERGYREGYFVTKGENVVDVMGIATTAEVYGDVFGVAIAAPLVRMEGDEELQAARLLAARDRLQALGSSL